MRRTLLVACLFVSKFAVAQGPAAYTVNNGVEYVASTTEAVYENKHPFYQSDQFSDGEITYFGRHYKHVKLKYDLSIDRVITLWADGRTEIVLYPEQVDSFKVYDQTFVKLPDSLGLPSGFYARLYQTPDYTYYVHFTKSISHRVFMNGGFYDVVADHHYDYLERANSVHSFKSIKDLGGLLNVEKKQTKTFLRDYPFDPGDDPIAIAARYRDYCSYVSK